MKKIILVEEIAEGLHSCGLSYWETPKNQSGHDWIKYREKLGKKLLERYDITEKPHNNKNN